MKKREINDNDSTLYIWTTDWVESGHIFDDPTILLCFLIRDRISAQNKLTLPVLAERFIASLKAFDLASIFPN